MPTTTSAGVDIYFEDTGGEGPPVVLVHGLASGLELNWRWSGWIDALVKAGRRVVALDCRGHGRSGKPHEPEAYGNGVMADDVVAVIDAAGTGRSDLLGYSMGGTIALDLVLRYPERFRSVVLGGFGLHDLATVESASAAAAEALTAPDPDSISDPAVAGWRRFLDATGQDRAALAACLRGQSLNEDEAAIRKLTLPMLIVCGDQDDSLPGARRLAALVPGSELVVLAGADHAGAVADQRFKDGVLAWLRRHSPA